MGGEEILPILHCEVNWLTQPCHYKVNTHTHFVHALLKWSGLLLSLSCLMKLLPRQVSWCDLTVLPDIFQLCFQSCISSSLFHSVYMVELQKIQLYCNTNLASLIIIEQNLTHSFRQSISLSLFMQRSTEGSSRRTLLWCEDETNHQSLHSISGSSGTTVLTRSSKHHSAPLTSDLNPNIT